ncbi:unnamed protein product [Spirodela intermedia]|uniref:Uncharacterized protein n=1 Tax=Spirodela intermedia TaxID=51605 RepID=A0ABN7E9K4_SPIIN|nr:unnamed protein product [Spirodela intermedia]
MKTYQSSSHLWRCHLVEQKNSDFAALWRLSPDREELDGGGRMLGSFMFRSTQQEEALHRICVLSCKIISFLEFIVSCKGIFVDPERLKS